MKKWSLGKTPYQSLWRVSKLLGRDVQKITVFDDFSGLAKKTLKITVFTTFPCPGQSAISDREREPILAKVSKMARIKHENHWFLAIFDVKTPIKTPCLWPKSVKMAKI